MHPEIAEQARQSIDAVKSGYCILVIPLLAEKGGYTDANRILVVDADEQMQMQRLGARDDIDRTQAEAILAAQATREQRLAIADDVIENSGTEADLREKVQEMHRFYLFLCESRSTQESGPD